MSHWSMMSCERVRGSLFFNRLDHLLLLCVLVVGLQTSLSPKEYSFCDEKSFSLSGDVKRKSER